MTPSKLPTIRVFGSSICDKCSELIRRLTSDLLYFTFIDALAEDTQDFCDEMNVEDLPHAQIVSADGTVLYEAIQNIDYDRLKSMYQHFLSP
jgi:hypothetical protein